MLSLTVKEGEYLMVGDVRVTFDRAATSEMIYVAVDAPKDMRVLRSRVYERKLEQEAEMTGDCAALERLYAEKERWREWKRERDKKRSAARQGAKAAAN